MLRKVLGRVVSVLRALRHRSLVGRDPAARPELAEDDERLATIRAASGLAAKHGLL
jgi:hypothetical protein